MGTAYYALTQVAPIYASVAEPMTFLRIFGVEGVFWEEEVSSDAAAHFGCGDVQDITMDVVYYFALVV